MMNRIRKWLARQAIKRLNEHAKELARTRMYMNRHYLPEDALGMFMAQQNRRIQIWWIGFYALLVKALLNDGGENGRPAG